MTTTEFKNEFLIGYDKITNYDAPGYLDDEISVFLTQSQERFIKTRYNAFGNKYHKGFEQNEKRRKELNNLISRHEVVSNTNTFSNHPYGHIVGYPDDFMWAIEESAENTSLCSDSKRVRIIPITHDQYTININNPFKKPEPGLWWRMEIESTIATRRVEIITDTNFAQTDTFTYYLRYLRLPSPIIVSDISPLTIDGISAQTECELNNETHREIIDGAIIIALENTEEKRLQTKVAVDAANE